METSAGEGDPLLLMFWNVENFYDYMDQGTGESDKEFSFSGSRYWTKNKFYRKCDAIAKAILWIGEENGRLPDAIGFAEIENRGVLTRMLNTSILRKFDYEIVHFDSPDRRGIDVALIYRRSVFSMVSTSLKLPEHEGKPLATRDMLNVCLSVHGGEKINLIVNHHPSKYGGSEESDGRRNAAMKALREMCDSLYMEGEDRIVAMGDFNDTPDGPAFGLIESVLVNKGMPLHRKKEGTIRYEGKWELIDMFLVSAGLEDVTEMEVCKIPFLMTWEKKHPGHKPLRTYSGPRYVGGVSDHCPILLKINSSHTL